MISNLLGSCIISCCTHSLSSGLWLFLHTSPCHNFRKFLPDLLTEETLIIHFHLAMQSGKGPCFLGPEIYEILGAQKKNKQRYRSSAGLERVLCKGDMLVHKLLFLHGTSASAHSSSWQLFTVDSLIYVSN